MGNQKIPNGQSKDTKGVIRKKIKGVIRRHQSVIIWFQRGSLHWYFQITPLVSFDYAFGIFWLRLWYLLIAHLVSSEYLFGIFVFPLRFWLLLFVSSDYHPWYRPHMFNN
jgi:hypothetical protein